MIISKLSPELKSHSRPVGWIESLKFIQARRLKNRRDPLERVFSISQSPHALHVAFKIKLILKFEKRGPVCQNFFLTYDMAEDRCIHEFQQASLHKLHHPSYR